MKYIMKQKIRNPRLHNLGSLLVPKEGLEPSRVLPRRILSFAKHLELLRNYSTSLEVKDRLKPCKMDF